MGQQNSRASKWTKLLVGCAVAAGALQRTEVRAQAINPGIASNCINFRVALPAGLGPSFDVTDEGWVWVEPLGRHYRQATGVVTGSKVAHNDTPSNHDSHDQATHVRLDPGQEDMLSLANPDTLEIEWEIGTRPSEKSGDGANPTFPKWVWPSVGDRMWANGNWVFDCGHGTEVDGVERFRTEIHPPRAP